MSTKKYMQLSLRDLGVAKWIAEQGAIRVNMLNEILKVKYGCELEARAIRALAKRLADHKLVFKEQILSGSSVIWPTGKALEIAGYDIKQGEKIGKPSLALLNHLIAVAKVRLVYEKQGALWISERFLRRDMPEHLPDGLAILDNQKRLIEVELTLKEFARLQKIMLMNLSKDDYLIDYWTNKETERIVRKAIESLPINLRERVTILDVSQVSK